MKELDADQLRRKARFDAIFDAMPGKNADKLRQVASMLKCKPNTVRIWRLKKPHTIISYGRLAMLDDLVKAAALALTQQGESACTKSN